MNTSSDPKRAIIRVRLNREMEEFVNQLCTEEGKNTSEVIRDIIKFGMDQYKRESKDG